MHRRRDRVLVDPTVRQMPQSTVSGGGTRNRPEKTVRASSSQRARKPTTRPTMPLYSRAFELTRAQGPPVDSRPSSTTGFATGYLTSSAAAIARDPKSGRDGVADVVELSTVHEFGTAGTFQVDGHHGGHPAGPRGHDDHLIAEEDSLGDRVGHEQGCCGAFGPDPEQLDVQVLAGHLVQSAEGLVEEKDVRIEHERPGDRGRVGASRPTTGRGAPRWNPRGLQA